MTQPTPSQPAAPAGAGPSGPRANFGQRLGAYVVDVIVLAIPYVILLMLFDQVIAYVAALVVGIAYWGYLEGSASGQTLGKKLLKIRVIDFGSGGPIGVGRAIVRYVARIVSGLPCALGYLWMLWDREKQTWHDKLATTVVVPESAYPVEKWPG